MKNHIYYLLLFLPVLGYSQFNNSQKQTILNLQNGELKFFNIGGGETSFESNFRKREIFSDRESYYDKTSEKEANLLSRRNTAINFKAGISNIGKFIDLDKLSFEDKGFLISFSRIRSFTQLVVPPDTESESMAPPFPLNVLKYGVQIEMDNFNRFDPLTEDIKDSKPVTASIIGSWTRLLFGPKTRINAFSLNWQFDLITYDESEFSTNFKRFDDVINTNDEVVSFKEFDGRFGTLENNVQRYQISASHPFLSARNFKEDRKVRVVPIPYVSAELITGGNAVTSTVNGKPKGTVGLILGFSTKPVFGKVEEYGDDKSEKPIELNMEDGSKITYKNYKYRKFSPPSFIYFGIDNTIQVGAEPQLNFFLAGSFSFD